MLLGFYWVLGQSLKVQLKPGLSQKVELVSSVFDIKV